MRPGTIAARSLSSGLPAAHLPRPVAHVTIGVGNPSETFVEQAIAAVEKRGWESHVFGVHRHRNLDVLPPDRIVCTEGAAWLNRAAARLTWRSPHDRFARQLVAEAQARGIRIVHAHFGWSAVYAVPLARMLDRPLVVSFYGSDASVAPSVTRLPRGRLPGRRWNPYDDVFRRATGVIAVSRYVEERLRRLGYQGSVKLVRNGVDTTQLPLRDQAPPLEPGPRLVFVGRLVSVKGADVLLDAMPEILLRHPSAQLEVIGDGDQRAALERRAHGLGVEHAVGFRGMLHHPRALAAMVGAHAVVVPSRVTKNGAAESSSMAFKEAMAMGVPVVATRCGGLAETCPPDLRHELVTPDDPAALARAVLAVIDAPQSWPARTAIGRSWVSERYNAQQLGDGLTACYATAITDYERGLR
jgi:colanic acid/amylovoran biosynthesis glycosyltransferase